MTTTPPDAPTGPPPGNPPADGSSGPRVSADEIRDLGRLRRSSGDRKVAGVAGGLARHLDIDPLVLRVAFVVLAFFGGAGILLYGACWLLVPDDATGRAPVSLDDRSRTIALLIVGAIATLALVGDTWGAFWFPWPLAVVALVVWLLVSRKERASSQPHGSAGWAPVTPPPPPGQAGVDPAYGTAAYRSTTTYGQVPPVPPARTYPRPPLPPRDPRKQGPILFWFTLALIALGIGVLGTIDVAGVAVPAGAYPAVAVGTTGVMLLVGAFYGRAGGLILLGLLTTVGLLGASAADRWEGDTVRYTPTTSTAVQDSYDLDSGEVILDLTQVQDLDGLDGRTLELDANVGRIEVRVPDGLDVRIKGTIDGPGGLNLFGDEAGGIGTTMTRDHDGGPGSPSLTIDAHLSVGEITTETE